jgi:hypothetical protein
VLDLGQASVPPCFATAAFLKNSDPEERPVKMPYYVKTKALTPEQRTSFDMHVLKKAKRQHRKAH